MMFIPSRGRRAGLQNFFDKSKPVVVGRVLIDDDDLATYEGMALPAGWEFLVGPRLGVVGSMNRAFGLLPDEPWYAVFTDDAQCECPGWDVTLAASCMPNRVSWGDDGRWGARFCTAFFVGGDLVRHMGFMLAPMFGHLYADKIWSDIAEPAGLTTYHPGIRWSHNQVHDQTYSERKIDGDKAMYRKIRDDGTMNGWIQRARKLH